MTAGKIGRTVATVDVALIGATGRVGRRVLDLIATRQDACRCAAIRPRLVAGANSRRTLIARDGIAPDVAVALLQASEPPQPGAVALAEALVHLASHPLIIIDCTASADIAAHYPRWLAAGIDVVTPNKIASSADRP